MDEYAFKSAIAAISSGTFEDSDVKIVSSWLVSLGREELELKKRIEKEKKEFLKIRDKSNAELKSLRKKIRQINNILCQC